MNPLVSIMIATYNQPAYIKQAVESCLGQDYANLEVVVGDDSTNDETYEVLKPLLANPKLKYFKNEVNLGRVKNYRHLLFNLAKGDWAVMLDGDDFYADPGFISKAVSFINGDSTIVLVAAGHLTWDEGNDIKTPEVLVKEDAVFEGAELFHKQIRLGQHSTNIYKRTLATELDFYRLDSMGTDSEGLFRLALHGKVVYLSDIVVWWRIHNLNNTFKADDALKQMHEMKFIDNVYDYSLQFLDKKTALSWRKYMYTAMSYHVINLAERSGKFINVMRVLKWASEFWGWRATLRYFKRYVLNKLKPGSAGTYLRAL